MSVDNKGNNYPSQYASSADILELKTLIEGIAVDIEGLSQVQSTLAQLETTVSAIAATVSSVQSSVFDIAADHLLVLDAQNKAAGNSVKLDQVQLSLSDIENLLQA